MEYWQVNFPIPGRTARMAKRGEDAGWDGLAFGDTQCITGDVYVGMALAAEATTRIKLSTGVTNPVTRHPSVTAAAIASVHAASGGRAVLGIGRGDSALGYINRRPASVPDFETYVQQVQGYLSGEPVDCEGFASTADWIRRLPLPKVHVDIAGSGPRVIAMGAREGDGLMFALGADPGRIAQAVAWAKDERKAAGKDPGDLTFGAYINVATNRDVDAARAMVAGAALTMARFSAAANFGAPDPQTRDLYRRASEQYELTKHASSDGGHGAGLPPEFIDRFAVLGPPEACAERLLALEAAGLDRVVVLFGARDGDREQINAGLRLFVDQVLPKVR